VTRTAKLALWALGAAAVLNSAADLWFRVSISAASHAPWYVWAPVGLTLLVVAAGLIGHAVSRRLRTGEVDEASEIDAEFVDDVAVEFYREGRDAARVEAVKALAVERLQRAEGRRYEVVAVTSSLRAEHAERPWCLRVLCREAEENGDGASLPHGKKQPA